MKKMSFKKMFDKKNLAYFISFCLSFLSFFFSFFPYLYTLEKGNKISFINEYQMFVFLQDNESKLHLSVTFYVVSLVLSSLILLSSIYGFFGKKETKRFSFAFIYSLSLIQFGLEIAAMVLLGQCKNMNLNLEFGSYFSVISKGLVFIALTFFLVKSQYLMTKAS